MRKADNLTTILCFLEPSGPLQACNGTNLPLLLPPASLFLSFALLFLFYKDGLNISPRVPKSPFLVFDVDNALFVPNFFFHHFGCPDLCYIQGEAEPTDAFQISLLSRRDSLSWLAGRGTVEERTPFHTVSRNGALERATTC